MTTRLDARRRQQGRNTSLPDSNVPRDAKVLKLLGLRRLQATPTRPSNLQCLPDGLPDAHRWQITLSVSCGSWSMPRFGSECPSPGPGSSLALIPPVRSRRCAKYFARVEHPLDVANGRWSGPLPPWMCKYTPGEAFGQALPPELRAQTKPGVPPDLLRMFAPIPSVELFSSLCPSEQRSVPCLCCGGHLL